MSDKACILCCRSTDDPLQYGEKFTCEGTTAHLYCLVCKYRLQIAIEIYKYRLRQAFNIQTKRVLSVNTKIMEFVCFLFHFVALDIKPCSEWGG